MATVVEVIFLGTGTSSCVPTVSCLTSEKKSCQVCLSSQTPEGIKNCRKNTSFIVRFRNHADPPHSRLRNVLIDCGKTFYTSAIHILPKYGIRQLDGVIISHGHADACYGMDDLRGWTLGGAIQSVIHVHLAPETMDTVALTFPFLVDSKMATGGGEVADFRYHVFDPTKSFTIQGLEFTPLAVHHGIYMTTKEPYICYGFHFDGVSYISDTNFIPPKVYDMMKNKTKLFVVDCLREDIPHPSHFDLAGSIDACEKVKPIKSYLVGFAHRVDHYKLEEKLKKMKGLLVTPAYDGLRVSIQPDQFIESSYLDNNVYHVKHK